MNTNTATETATDTSIGQTILDQINASDFWARARWGVKEKLAITNGLQMNCTKGIKIIVTLDPSDTYTVKVGRMGRGAARFDFVVKGEASDVYVDSLVQITDSLFSAAFGNI